METKKKPGVQLPLFTPKKNGEDGWHYAETVLPTGVTRIIATKRPLRAKQSQEK